MKKELILTVVMLVGVLSLFSQTFTLEPPEKQMTQTVTTDPVSLISGVFNGSYERVLSSSGSIQVSAVFRFLDLGIAKYSAFGGSAGYRYYLYETAPFGFYVAPNVGVFYGSTEEVINDTDSTLFLLLAGGVAGYQWIHTNGFVVDLSVGFAATFGGPLGTIISPALGFAVGYGW